MNTKTKTSKGGNGVPEHAVVSQDEWLAARKELLKEEKEYLFSVRARERDVERRLWLPRPFAKGP